MRAMAVRKAAPTRAIYVGGPCRECGDLFVAKMSGSWPQYCSERCAKRNRRRRDKKARNRRIRTAATRESIDLAALALRDGWRCHICGRRVTRKTWSMDHLVPLSDGGEHTYANVALAHSRCNAMRGRTGHAQLRLAA